MAHLQPKQMTTPTCKNGNDPLMKMSITLVKRIQESFIMLVGSFISCPLGEILFHSFLPSFLNFFSRHRHIKNMHEIHLYI